VKLIGRDELGEVVLLRNPDDVALSELFRAGGHRFPLPEEVAWLRRSADVADGPMLDWLEAVATSSSEALSRSVGSVLSDAPTIPSGVSG
jgi:hypothetical protein